MRPNLAVVDLLSTALHRYQRLTELFFEYRIFFLLFVAPYFIFVASFCFVRKVDKLEWVWN